ncbi:MAG: serine hydrolase [Leptolyngbyaceae cyanobacterium MO_188.B28]|nr:serine hydrolase [Leptolyngbyaceae cyanobacterium MO_188.B28]
MKAHRGLKKISLPVWGLLAFTFLTPGVWTISQRRANSFVPLGSMVTQETDNAFSAGDRSDLGAEIDAYMKAYDELGWFFGSIIVVHKGEILLSQGYGMASLEHQAPNSPQTRFRLASVTKQFTAAAILQFQDRGLLDVQAPISTYLPDYPNGDRITAHHLMTHTSGVINYNKLPGYSEWRKLPTTLDDLIARFKDLPLEFEPGEQYRYSNSGYELLTQLIETISGQSYADYLKENLLGPLGMENTGYEDPIAVINGMASGYRLTDDGYQRAQHYDMSVALGSGGLYSTVEDLARWNQFLFGSGGRDETILSNEAIAAMISPHVEVDPIDDHDIFYGYGLYISNDAEDPFITHRGALYGFRSFLRFHPNQNLTIAVLCNLETADLPRIAYDLTAIVLGEPYDPPSLPEAVTVDPSVYENYVGVYQVDPDFQLAVFIEADQLKIQETEWRSLTLYPSSETAFFSRIKNVQIVFNQATDGTVKSLTVFENYEEIVIPKVD